MPRILVVDDSATVRRVAVRALESAGFDVAAAIDGKDGLEIASTSAFDLVITDFVMPHMNGFQLVQSLRAIANLARVPVVLMSAKADRIGDGFLAQTGAIDAITKPFSPEALIAVATQALARAASGTNAAASPAPPSSAALEAIVRAETAALDAEHARLAQRIAEKLAAITAEAAGAEAPAIARAILATIAPEALLAAAGELAELVPGLRGEVSLEGRAAHVPLGEILQLLQHQRQTGVLEVRRGRDAIAAEAPRDSHAAPPRSLAEAQRTISVCMSHGAIDLAIGRAGDAEFLLGRYLLEEELIDRDDLARLLEQRSSGPRTLLGTRLVKLGYLSSEDLSRALVRQSSELVYEALRWRDASYRFVRLATRPEAAQARLGLPIGSILMEGLRRVDEWRLIEEQIRSWDEVLRPDREAIATLDLDRLSREERVVLEAVDGARSIREIVAHVRMGSFEASKILFQLLTSRLVRRAA